MALRIETEGIETSAPAAPEEVRRPSRLGGIGRMLSRLCLNEPAVYEIRNVRTGDSPVYPVQYTDGTAADRAARRLGPDWRVFRADEHRNDDLRHLIEAISK
jgi:hypothetical protein